MEFLYTTGRNVKWYSHCGKQYGDSSKKLKIELPHDTAIPLMGIYPKELKAGSCTPMFIAALFTIAKAWKQPKSPSRDEWGFPGGAVVENLPASAGDTGSSPGLGRSHMLQSN